MTNANVTLGQKWTLVTIVVSAVANAKTSQLSLCEATSKPYS